MPIFIRENPTHRDCSRNQSGYNEKAPGWGYQGQKGSSVDDRNYHTMDRAKINSAFLK